MSRPPRDWQTLYEDWLATDLPKSVFLRSRGINPTSGSAYLNTRAWEGERRRTYLVGSSPHQPTSESLGVELERIEASANIDVETVDAPAMLERHIGLLLKASLPGGAAHGRLSAYELVRFTEALSHLRAFKNANTYRQPTSDQSEIVGESPDLPRNPKYTVEVTKGGKFKRSRPVLTGCEALDRKVDHNVMYVVETWDKEGRIIRLKPRSAVPVTYEEQDLVDDAI